MNNSEHRSQLAKLFITVVFLIGLTLLAFTIEVKKIQAQSNNSWSEPVNLSQSGSGSRPVLVVDFEGIFHAVWSDKFTGHKYVSGDGVEWSQPAVVDLLFGDAVPELLADKGGFIHAFWLDSDFALNYSTVRATDFASASSWATPVKLAESAFDFKITIDQNDNLHLIYIRPLDSTNIPAGVYYLKMVKGNTDWTWSSPALIYASPYFRSIEFEDSSVDIATSTIDETVQVYAVWDNRPRERVYLAISTDEGQTWGSAEEIDKPDSGLGYNSTREILVNAYDQDILLVWQRSTTGGSCSQYYQKSTDGGETWSQPNKVSSDSSSCGQDNQLISDENGMSYLWTILQNQVTLYAWDRRQWSNPQVQNEISSFIDPESQKIVIYDCRQPVLDGSQRLSVLGCDTSGGGDIWFTYRALNDIDNWFSSDSAWGEAEGFVSNQDEIDDLVLIAVPDNNLLALWSQSDLGADTPEHAAIHLARWDGESWTLSGPIFRSSQGSMTQPVAAIDGEERVIAVWSASMDGKLYFSWANVARAQNPTEWSEPIPLPNSLALAQSPQILINNSQKIIVVYTVPINEGRGIYLTQSEDGGETWSSPLMIFDGSAANWQMIDHPQLVETPDGGLHMLWSQRSILDGEKLLGLYYARSEDGGNTWSAPEIVKDNEVMWSQISTYDQESLVRVWQEGNQLQPVIKYQFSQDNGLSWSDEESLGSFGEKSLMARLTAAPAGNTNMLQIIEASSGDLFLRHWIWENGRWFVHEYFDLSGGLLEEATSMASTVSSEGNLAMILSAKARTEPGNPDLYGLFFTNSALNLPAVNPTQTTTAPAINITPNNTPVPFPTSTSIIISSPDTPVVQTTPTPTHSTSGSSEPPGSSNNSFLGAGLGVFLSALIVVAAVIIGVWRVRSKR